MLEELLARQRSRAVGTIHRVMRVARVTGAPSWHKLPTWLGLANLIGLLESLRSENLHDTNSLDGAPAPEAANAPPVPVGAEARKWRTADGSHNDLARPTMGKAGTRFGRNFALHEIEAPARSSWLMPNPRVISEVLLARDRFVPATSLNVLAAAWIQFMTRDWFSHGTSSDAAPHEIPLLATDDWHERPMRVAPTRPDPTRCPFASGPPSFVNEVTHWWDASQIYGSDAARQQRLRAQAGGKLRLTADGHLLSDPGAGSVLTGFASPDTLWTPLALLHMLFAREHNAICDALQAAYPSWDDAALFEHARLINAALLAKIHMLEWSKALLTHPTVAAAMDGSWWGLFGERMKEKLGRLGESDARRGLAGGSQRHFGVPYAITEEFVAVYRMHSLLPDEFTLRALRDDRVHTQCGLRELIGTTGLRLLDTIGAPNLFYSFGVAHPGALRLHNYPNALRKLQRADGSLVDLATVDVLRDRERGVPRYTEFRRMLRLPVPRSFHELTDDAVWARELRAVYKRLDHVDLLPGMLAEPLPDGMAFGDTAFHIMILMAARRLNSDRFFTADFSEEVYSELGMQWIRENTLSSVLLRHFPALAPALAQVDNPFRPWKRVQMS